MSTRPATTDGADDGGQVLPLGSSGRTMSERRALPGWAVDLIRDGADLRGRGDRAVDDALVRTAMVAQRYGWTWPDWSTLVLERCCSRLGEQASRRSDGKPADLDARLRRAWRRAEVRAVGPAMTAADVPERIATVRAWLDGDRAPVLSVEERAVMLAAVELAVKYGTTRPAVPLQALAAITDLTRHTIGKVLDRLDSRGLLATHSRGRASGQASKRRARTVRLPTARARAAMSRSGAPMSGKSTPVSERFQDHEKRSTPMSASDVATVSIAVTGSAEAVKAALEILASHGAAASAAEPTELPENVVPLQRRDGAS